MDIKVKPTTSSIADLINQLNESLKERYGDNYSVIISGDQSPLAVKTNFIDFVPPEVEPAPKAKPVICRHRRDDKYGWTFDRQAVADSHLWDKSDLGWINTLLESGDFSLVIGHLMYEVKIEKP